MRDYDVFSPKSRRTFNRRIVMDVILCAAFLTDSFTFQDFVDAPR